MLPCVPEMEGLYASGGGRGGVIVGGSILFFSFFLRLYFWWCSRTMYLLVCQVRVTVGNSGLCCVCGVSFER